MIRVAFELIDPCINGSPEIPKRSLSIRMPSVRASAEPSPSTSNFALLVSKYLRISSEVLLSALGTATSANSDASEYPNRYRRVIKPSVRALVSPSSSTSRSKSALKTIPLRTKKTKTMPLIILKYIDIIQVII